MPQSQLASHQPKISAIQSKFGNGQDLNRTQNFVGGKKSGQVYKNQNNIILSKLMGM